MIIIGRRRRRRTSWPSYHLGCLWPKTKVFFKKIPSWEKKRVGKSSVVGGVFCVLCAMYRIAPLCGKGIREEKRQFSLDNRHGKTPRENWGNSHKIPKTVGEKRGMKNFNRKWGREREGFRLLSTKSLLHLFPPSLDCFCGSGILRDFSFFLLKYGSSWSISASETGRTPRSEISQNGIRETVGCASSRFFFHPVHGAFLKGEEMRCFHLSEIAHFALFYWMKGGLSFILRENAVIRTQEEERENTRDVWRVWRWYRAARVCKVFAKRFC